MDSGLDNATNDLGVLSTETVPTSEQRGKEIPTECEVDRKEFTKFSCYPLNYEQTGDMFSSTK